MKRSRDIPRREVLATAGGILAGGMISAPASAMRSLIVPAAFDSPIKTTIVNTGGDETVVIENLLKKQGYLAQMGLDATTLNVGDGSKLMGGLFNGDADISILSGFSQVFTAVERGAKMKILAGSSLLVEQCVYTKRPDIRSLKDLVGKTVGTGSLGALLHQVMIALFEKYDIDHSKVTFANIGSAADVFRAVVAGSVDAGPGPLAVYDQQAQYGVHSLSDGNVWSELPEYIYQGAYTTDQKIAEKRDALVRVLAAYAKLFRFLQAPDSEATFVQVRVDTLSNPKSNIPLIQAAGSSEWEFFQKYKPYAVDLILAPEKLQYMQELGIKTGVQKNLLPFDQVADMSLAQEALKLIG